MDPAHIGILVILAGAFANAAFGLGIKYTRTWQWEHIWLLFSFFGMLVIPWVTGFLTIDSLLSVLASANGHDLLLVFLYGVGWGAGAVLYGLALKRIGIALSYAIVLGLAAAVGTLAPFVMLHIDDVLTPKGLMIAVTVLLIVVGVALSAWAGQLRENASQAPQDQKKSPEPDSARKSGSSPFIAGIVVAILSGIFSSMLNLSFAYGKPLAELAETHVAAKPMAANIIWVVALSGGFLVNAGYCAFLISRNKSWPVLVGQPFHYGIGLAMGILWSSGVICYGFGGWILGDQSEVTGWPAYSAMAIISGTFWGAIAGEWKGAGRKPVTVMGMSIIVLTAAIFIIARLVYGQPAAPP